jgi:hypothetical protein
VPVALFEPQLALHDEGPAGPVHDPAAADRGGLVAVREGHLVPVGAELHVLDPGAAAYLHAGGLVAGGELVLEASPVELVRGNRRLERHAPLDALGKVGVVAGREEVAEPDLVQLVGLDVVLHTDHFPEVVGAQLDGGLTDLEGGLRGRTLALLEDQDRGVGALLLQLQAQGQGRKPAPEHHDVVSVTTLVVRHVLLLADCAPTLTQVKGAMEAAGQRRDQPVTGRSQRSPSTSRSTCSL